MTQKYRQLQNKTSTCECSLGPCAFSLWNQWEAPYFQLSESTGGSNQRNAAVYHASATGDKPQSERWPYELGNGILEILRVKITFTIESRVISR